MQNQRKFQESHKERHFTKEISSSFHVSYISEIFLKHLSTFASQPKEISQHLPNPAVTAHGCWERHSQASRLAGIKGVFYFPKYFGNLFCNSQRESQIFTGHHTFEFAGGSAAPGEWFVLGSFLF